MMNPAYHIKRVRDLLDEIQPSRERSLAATKLDEFEMWLSRCQPTDDALNRDQASRSVIVDAGPLLAGGTIRGADIGRVMVARSGVKSWYDAIDHAGPGCACGINGAGDRFVDPICVKRGEQTAPSVPIPDEPRTT